MLLANTPSMIPDGVLQVAAQSGFNAVLVLVLLYYGRQELMNYRREMSENRKAQDRNSKVVAIALIQLASLVSGAKPQLQSIVNEIDEADRKNPSGE